MRWSYESAFTLFSLNKRGYIWVTLQSAYDIDSLRTTAKLRRRFIISYLMGVFQMLCHLLRLSNLHWYHHNTPCLSNRLSIFAPGNGVFQDKNSKFKYIEVIKPCLKIISTKSTFSLGVHSSRISISLHRCVLYCRILRIVVLLSFCALSFTVVLFYISLYGNVYVSPRWIV